MSQHAAATSPQSYARVAGILFLISIVAGGFGEGYVPSLLIASRDPATTAAHFTSMDLLFRIGFASYLVEALCDVSLALILYVLLRPVHRDLALLTAFFGLVSTAVFAVAVQLFHFAPSFMLRGEYLKAFTPDQVNALAYLSLRFSSYGGGLFLVFYGVASVLRGYLIFKSGYLPRALGVLLALGGLGFTASNFALVLAPKLDSALLLAPMILAMLVLGLWLLVRGVDVQKWREQAG